VHHAILMVAVGERVHIHGLPVDARRRGPRIVNRWNLRHLRQAIPAHYRSRLSIGVRSGPQMVDPTAQPRVAVFRRTLHELGWKEEENLQIVYRWNAGDAQHVNVSAAELVELQPDVIICQRMPQARWRGRLSRGRSSLDAFERSPC
jgi:hypothetical protein